MNAWSHLPNAAVIDEVLKSLRKQPKAWDAAWGAAWDTAWDAARDAARDAAWGAARGAMAALIAYDDAGKLIKQPVAHLQGLYRLDPHPMFLLLQPASIVFNQLEFKT